MTTTPEPTLPPEAVYDIEPAGVVAALVHFAEGLDETDDPAEIGERAAGDGVWSITDDRGAEYAMRVRMKAADRIAAADADRRAYIDRIDAWHRAAIREHVATMAFMDRHLCDYQRRRREADDSAKTLVLPSGKVRSTAHAAAVFVVDEPAVIEWARANLPEALNVKTSLYASVIKAQIAPVVECDTSGAIVRSSAVFSTGEVVPGMGVEAPSITVKVSAP